MLGRNALVTALGLPAGAFKAELKDLMELDHPAIVPIHYAWFKPFVVVKTIKDGRVFIADPSQGNITFTVERFKDAWDQNVLFVVFPGNTKPVDGLELREEDLRYIDDQTLSLQAFQHITYYEDMLQYRLQTEFESQKNLVHDDTRSGAGNTSRLWHYIRT